MSSSKRNDSKHLISLLATFAGLIGVLAVVLAGLMLPSATAVGIAVKRGTESFDSLPDDFKLAPPSEQSRILATDGSVLANFYAEDRIIVAGDQINDSIKKAIVAIEDRRFFQHHGVDSQGVIRAFFSNVTGGSTQGASTLTQQLVKNTLIEAGLQSNDRLAIARAKEATLGRKLREMNYALALEKKWTKEQILDRYLNIAPFGSNVYGVEAASLRYFSIHAKDLNVSQAALLAGITQSPVSYDPLRNPKNAEARRNKVANAMLEVGYIDQKTHDEIVATPIEKLLKPSNRRAGCAAAGTAGHFCDLVIAEISGNDALGKTRSERTNLLLRGGITIQTTLNPKMQKQAYEAIVNRIPIDDPSKVRIALSSVEPGTGKIRAMVQNTNYGRPSEADPNAVFDSYNANADAGGGMGRPTGSTFKTMTIGAWFEDKNDAYNLVGGKYTFYPRDFKSTCEDTYTLSEPWKVANTTNMGRSPISVLTATEYSVNTSFVDMASKLGDLCKVRSFAERVGAVDGEGKIGTFTPSSIIGANNVTPLNLANAYATLGGNGKRCKPYAVENVKDRNGEIIAAFEPKCDQTVDPKVAAQVTKVLNLTNESYHRRGFGNIGRPAASKTGTSTGSTNTWTVGYTPQLSTAVWVGNPKGEVPMMGVRINGKYYRILYGQDIAMSAWMEYMRGAHEGIPVKKFPEADIGRPKPPPEPKNQTGDDAKDNNRNVQPKPQSGQKQTGQKQTGQKQSGQGAAPAQPGQ